MDKTNIPIIWFDRYVKDCIQQNEICKLLKMSCRGWRGRTVFVWQGMSLTKCRLTLFNYENNNTLQRVAAYTPWNLPLNHHIKDKSIMSHVLLSHTSIKLIDLRYCILNNDIIRVIIYKLEYREKCNRNNEIVELAERNWARYANISLSWSICVCTY